MRDPKLPVRGRAVHDIAVAWTSGSESVGQRGQLKLAALVPDETLTSEVRERSGYRLTRRPHHVRQQLVREGQVERNTAGADRSVNPGELKKLVPHAVSVPQAGEVAQAFLTIAQSPGDSIEDDSGRSRDFEELRLRARRYQGHAKIGQSFESLLACR